MILPVPLSSLVGREREMAAVAELLERSRLVTLTGAAGSGKTRLALAVLHHIADGPRAAWVDLALLADPALLAAHVAARIGAREIKHRSPVETLSAALRDRPSLLVLDNCEHLADACARLIETLLLECPALRVLATSREALGIAGEQAWLVPLLSVEQSVTLFGDRARAVLPAFAMTRENAHAIEAICRRLDGLPLAIELAAARIPLLAPAQLVARLDDALRLLGAGARTAPPRQRTLVGAIDWSYALLNDSERLLFARLSVFPVSFSLTAVERVCADEILPPDEILDTLAALVEKSLVMMELRTGEARYRMLEVVRQYARERLARSVDEVQVRMRHATFFLELVERFADEDEMLGFAAGACVSLLDDEMPNLRAVFEWGARDPSGADAALRLGRALHWFWIATGQFAEGSTRLTRAIAHGERATARARAHARTTLGFLALCQRDRSSVRSDLEECVRVLRQENDAGGVALAQLGLGMADLMDGDATAAGERLADALVMARAADRPALIGQVLYWLGSSARARGDLVAAAAALEEAVGITRRPRLEFAFAYCATRLGVLRHFMREETAALTWLGEALAIHRAAAGQDRWGSVQVLDAISGVAVAMGRPRDAARLLGAVEEHCRTLDVTAPLDLREFHDEFSATARAALGDTAFEQARDDGRALQVERALGEAVDLVNALIGTAPATKVSQTKPATPALRVLALGSLEIQRDGDTIPVTAWRAARPRELLLYLLCHRLGRTRDQIALQFWPDAAPARIKNNFHVALHLLRKAVARADIILFDHERYRVNWELGVEFDAVDFEDQIRAALKTAPDDRRADALRNALARYRGDFLEDAAAGDWHLEHRDHLRRLYVDGLLALGTHEEAASRFAEASAAYRRILAADAINEAASRGVMRCHARLGQRTDALREFERLSRVLRAELDAAPDAETHALAERLRSAESFEAH